MEKEVLVKIEGKEWEKALDEAFKVQNKKAKIDGFRPGKATKDVFIKKYGIETLFMEATEKCVDLAYHRMIDENKDLELAASPQLNVNSIDEKHVEFKFILTTKPQITLGKYTGLNVKKEKATVSKKEIAEAIEQMQSRYMENVDKDGKIAEGDVAIIDFEGFNDGVPFAGGKGENYSLKIGSHTFIPGFEEQLIGVSKGEEKDLTVTFPEDYPEENLKGKEVVFKVKVNEIKEQVLPELNEDFFEDLGMEGINTKDALEKQLEENIKTRKETELENKYLDDLLEAAAKNTKLEIPEVMIKEETDRILGQYEEQLKMQGINLEMFYQFTNSNEEALREQMKEEAVNRITYRLMLEAIAEKEDIDITDEEADSEADVLSEKYQMTKDEFLKAFGGLEMIKYDLKMRRAIEVLKN